MSVFGSNIYTRLTTELFGFGVTLNPDGSVATVTGATIEYVTAPPTAVRNAGSLALQSNGVYWGTSGGGVWYVIGGGVAFASVADSAAIVQAAAGYVAFNSTYNIPANVLRQATTLRIRAVVRITTVLNAAATAQARLRLGGATLVTSPESTAGAVGTRATLEAVLTFRAAPGAAVEASGTGTAIWSDTTGTIISYPNAAVAVPTFATNGALLVDVAAECSGAGDGSGRLVCEQLIVEIM